MRTDDCAQAELGAGTQENRNECFSRVAKTLGTHLRLRVDDSNIVCRLLERMSASFVFKTSEPMDEALNSSGCTFRVAHTSQISGAGLEKLWARIPEVQLVLEAA